MQCLLQPPMGKDQDTMQLQKCMSTKWSHHFPFHCRVNFTFALLKLSCQVTLNSDAIPVAVVSIPSLPTLLLYAAINHCDIRLCDVIGLLQSRHRKQCSSSAGNYLVYTECCGLHGASNGYALTGVGGVSCHRNIWW